MPEDTDQLVIYELAALESRLLETLDLLLDDNFEGSGANEKRWGGALHKDLVQTKLIDREAHSRKSYTESS